VVVAQCNKQLCFDSVAYPPVVTTTTLVENWMETFEAESIKAIAMLG